MQEYIKLVSIPTFVQKYIESEIGIEIIVKDFCSILANSDFEVMNVGGKIKYTFYVGSANYTIKRFVEFYKSKCLNNNTYECLYEEELDLYQSIGNEVFLFDLNNEIIALCIDDYIEGKLYMIK